MPRPDAAPGRPADGCTSAWTMQCVVLPTAPRRAQRTMIERSPMIAIAVFVSLPIATRWTARRGARLITRASGSRERRIRADLPCCALEQGVASTHASGGPLGTDARAARSAHSCQPQHSGVGATAQAPVGHGSRRGPARVDVGQRCRRLRRGVLGWIQPVDQRAADLGLSACSSAVLANPARDLARPTLDCLRRLGAV
jgi:hypothetical protein